jgi:hypothetical protein
MVIHIRLFQAGDHGTIYTHSRIQLWPLTLQPIFNHGKVISGCTINLTRAGQVKLANAPHLFGIMERQSPGAKIKGTFLTLKGWNLNNRGCKPTVEWPLTPALKGWN